jgi:hypothetical protein
MRIPKQLLIACALATLLLAGCRRDVEQPPSLEAPAADAAAAAESDTIYTPQAGRDALTPDRIYFTLTDHEWYARGEPLLHGNAAYHPAGMPVSASLSDMHHAGEYQGVDYYVRDGDAAPTLYVPIYEGYWQRFSPDTARAAR